MSLGGGAEVAKFAFAGGGGVEAEGHEVSLMVRGEILWSLELEMSVGVDAHATAGQETGATLVWRPALHLMSRSANSSGIWS
jgi:hypothetical protein